MKQLVGILAVIITMGMCCNTDDPKPPLTGGTGGNSSITLFPKHHERAIPGVRIWIKYAANEKPSDTSKFDTVIQCAPTALSGKFSLLKKGSYYIYGIGYDSSISMNVKGGIPYELKDNENAEIILPITE